MADLPIWAGALILVLCLGVFLAAVGKEWSKRQALHPDKEMVSAFKTQKSWSLASTFFAAALCASALSANPEAGASGSWTSAISYGIANALPFLILIPLGPRLQEALGEEGFTLTDFVLKRLGIVMYIITLVLSLFFMFIWLTAELTAASQSFSELVPNFHPVVAPVVIAAVTASYALFSGFKASIITDRVQSLLALVFLLLTFVGVMAYADLSHMKEASTFHASDISGGFVLILSTTMNQFLDLGSWQRLFASQSHSDAKWGLFYTAILNFGCQSILATTGIIALSASIGGQIEMTDEEYGSGLFKLVGICPKAFSCFTLILAVILAASTVDSLENSLASAVAAPLIRSGYSLHWSRLIAILLIIPAIILASMQKSVLALFLLSNIFSTCIIPPIFLSIHWPMTKLGTISGFVSSFLSIFVLGWIFERDFVGGLQWPMFPRGFTHWSTLLTFVLVPSISAVVCCVISVLFPDPNVSSTPKDYVNVESSVSSSFSVMEPRTSELAPEVPEAKRNQEAFIESKYEHI